MLFSSKTRLFHLLLYALILQVLASCSTTSTTKKGAKSPTSKVKHSGMWLLPQVDRELYPKNSPVFSLAPDSIYATAHPSLNQAVVRININDNLSGTGSFVSQNGLILTNKSVASHALSSAGSNKNYLVKGFYADSLRKEIPLPDYNIYITIEQKEVTNQIKSQIPDSLSYHQKLIQAQKVRRKLIKERTGNNRNILVEINDFWGGNRQFMSVYKVIRDVRLVHAPPKSIANLTDDEWPRYSADYTFLRAYVSPNGNSQTYDSSNVPFHPAKYLEISSSNLTDHTSTLVMGYPGQTFRHKSSYALDFYHKQRNPIILNSYQAILDGMEYAAAQDSQKAIATAEQRASLKHTILYYRQLQQGIEKRDLINQKKKQENEFNEWISRDSLRKIRYRRVFEQLDQAYSIAGQTGDLLHATVYTLNNSQLLKIASLYNSYWQLLEDSTQNISRSYKDSLLTRHDALLEDINIKAQHITLGQMLEILTTLPEGKVMFHLLDLFGDAKGEQLKKAIEDYLTNQKKQSIIYDSDRARQFLSLPIDSARKKPVDEMVKLYQALIESYQFSKKNYVQYMAYQRPAYKRYLRGMMEYDAPSFSYPDANSTMRISTGNIQGYHPKDGIYYTPFTTLGGLMKQDATAFSFPDSTYLVSDSLVVNFLSTNDVTGGNSGSPVLNKNGELIGITFDLNKQGMVSDYKYNPYLSRAIGLNIKYVQFLLNQVLKTDRLIEEIND